MATSKPAIRRPTRKTSRSVTAPARWAEMTPKRRASALAQNAFLEVLRLERRRAERSGRPFVMVLVSGKDLQSEASGVLADTLVEVLSGCIRETDVLGWYTQSTTLGLLMTEIGEGLDETIEAIVQKITTILQTSLPSKTYRRLSLVVRAFPEDGEDRVFYPDLSFREPATRIDHAMKRAIDIWGSHGKLQVKVTPADLINYSYVNE